MTLKSMKSETAPAVVGITSKIMRPRFWRLWSPSLPVYKPLTGQGNGGKQNVASGMVSKLGAE